MTRSAAASGYGSVDTAALEGIERIAAWAVPTAAQVQDHSARHGQLTGKQVVRDDMLTLLFCIKPCANKGNLGILMRYHTCTGALRVLKQAARIEIKKLCRDI